MKKSFIAAILIPALLTGCAVGGGETGESGMSEISTAESGKTTEVTTEKNDSDVTADGIRYIPSEDDVSFSGRWFEKEIDGVMHHVTVNDGSELYFAVSGTDRVSVNFTVITEQKTPYFAVSVDGKEPVRQKITDPEVRLPDTGRHILRVITDGITESEKKFTEERGFAFRGVDPCGGVLEGVKPDAKTVMFFGDSITEGVRALSMDADSDGNSATHSYPWYCCLKLGMIPVNVGFAASGVVGAGSFAPCLDALDRLSASRTTDGIPAPDIVVVAHGHNDVWFKDTDVRPRYRAVLERLHEKYPDAVIISLIPFSQTHAQTISECAAEYDFVHLISTEGWNPDTTDGIHLNAAGAKSAGERLADEISKIIGG